MKLVLALVLVIGSVLLLLDEFAQMDWRKMTPLTFWAWMIGALLAAALLLLFLVWVFSPTLPTPLLTSAS